MPEEHAPEEIFDGGKSVKPVVFMSGELLVGLVDLHGHFAKTG